MPLTFADTVQPEKVAWLWPGYIPFGKVTMLDGDPGLGKSTILIDIAGKLSRGVALPNGKQHPPMGTILLMGEDGAGDTIVPRLINAQADLGRVGIRDTYTNDKEVEIPPSFPSDLEKLKEDIIAAQAGLVVVDPVMSYLDPDINSNNDQQVRRALMPLAMLAEETGAAIVLLRHLNKSQSGSALYRGGGSIGFVGVARSALIVARDPDDSTRVVLASTKSNLGPPPPALNYRLAGCENGAARVEWEGHSSHTAETLVQTQNTEEHGAMQDAVAFLCEILADGPMLVKTIQKMARDAMIADRTLRRAREALGITRDSPWIRKATTQDGQWVWELPPSKLAKNDQKAPGVDNLDNLANLATFTSSLENDHINIDSGQVGQVVQHRDVANFNTPEKLQPTPFNAPRVVKAGKYECVVCRREAWMSDGAPQLCPKHRQNWDRTGTEDD